MRAIKASIGMTSISLVLVILSLLVPMPVDATVYTTSVDFGEVELGSSRAITLSVTNPNRLAEIYVSLSIDDERCGFTIDKPEMSIPAGQRGLLRVNFAPRTAGACSAILRVESIAPEFI